MFVVDCYVPLWNCSVVLIYSFEKRKKNEGETDIGIYDINSICLPEIFDKEFQNQKL